MYENNLPVFYSLIKISSCFSTILNYSKLVLVFKVNEYANRGRCIFKHLVLVNIYIYIILNVCGCRCGEEEEIHLN